MNRLQKVLSVLTALLALPLMCPPHAHADEYDRMLGLRRESSGSFKAYRDDAVYALDRNGLSSETLGRVRSALRTVPYEDIYNPNVIVLVRGSDLNEMRKFDRKFSPTTFVEQVFNSEKTYALDDQAKRDMRSRMGMFDRGDFDRTYKNQTVISGIELNRLAAKGIPLTSKVFKFVSKGGAAAVVAGALMAGTGAAQAATVRADMRSGGAPVKLEDSPVGATTGFESFGSSRSSSSRSTRTAR